MNVITDSMINQLRKAYQGVRGEMVSVKKADEICEKLHKLAPYQLKKLAAADIDIISSLAECVLMEKDEDK